MASEVRSLLRRLLCLPLFLAVALASVQATAPSSKTTAAGSQATQPVPGVLTNEDILKLIQAKLGDSLIIAKIRTSRCQFDTSPTELIKLKEAGVSEAIMQAMAEAGVSPAGSPPAAAQPVADPNNPLAPHDPGIYVVKQEREGERMVQLEPTAYSQGRTGGLFKSAMTYGLAKSQWKAVVRGGKASMRVTESRPTFYFYFEGKSGAQAFSSPWMAWFGGISSPNQFVLARFQAKSSARELVVGEWGVTGTSMGTRDKDIVEFDFEKLGPGMYKVRPRLSLQPGEYCFFYTATNVAYGATGGNVFDFGVNPAQ